jgi:hypothetical protein
MCYLNSIERRKCLDLLYTLKRFYLYDLKNGKALTMVCLADDTNVWNFASTFVVISNFMALKQGCYGIYFPSQPVTKYRTHP